ncbi:mechanosensitive ion channel family protein [Flectobacillus longus]|uniref:mechanosensitive ion channel family protein n=1 Tax=Flectobacillus longus TaxID=2984207 RepID=UPI0024B7A7DD|nr:mechanosensitive ion channel domain-containing protein [Flectobacillus longus]MDI9881366.1 mechanosensitive ion channel [Flectobacillus longus]
MNFMYLAHNYLTNFEDKVWPVLLQYGTRVFMSLLLFLIGRLLIKNAIGLMHSKMRLESIDPDVQPFLASLVRAALNIMLVLSCASILGIETSSFIAALGAAGLAIGLALQGSLSNFAGGVLILVFKPFRVGELITVHGYTGYVESIQIFNTVISTTSHRTIILPNGSLSTSPVVNISRKGIIRLDMQFQVAMSNDIDATRKAIRAVIEECSFVQKDKNNDILVGKLTDSAIVWEVKLWVNATDLDKTQYFMNEHIKKQFDSVGIQFPDPIITVKSIG